MSSETDAGTTGVYVSLGPCSYRTGAAGDAAGGFFALTASDKDYGATRISYALDLTGPRTLCFLNPLNTRKY